PRGTPDSVLRCASVSSVRAPCRPMCAGLVAGVGLGHAPTDLARCPGPIRVRLTAGGSAGGVWGKGQPLEQAVAAAGPGDGGGGARAALGCAPAALERGGECGLALGCDRLCGEDVQLSHGSCSSGRGPRSGCLVSTLPAKGSPRDLAGAL